ncbi:MAG: DUF1385 domain-containing protein [Clostridia bacterium]|nr:DUF1385 domain-containing protein [Clostridia bacterium]
MAKYTAMGGQALIEGILMRSPEKTALAVRTPDKGIDITYMEQKSLKDKYEILKAPILRGVISFAESMIQGYKALMISAEKSGYTDVEDKEEHEERTEDEKAKSKEKLSKIINIVMVLGTVLGVVLAVVLFMLIPRLAVKGFEAVFATEFSKIARSSIEQLIKLIVLVAYMYGVSLMPDIKRVFMYHGAEHKTIFCYEHGLELTVENVRRERRFHPRCGTSFLILMILVSIIVSTVVQLIFPGVYSIVWLWVIAKILMVPVICGLGFELLRLCGRYDNLFTKIVSAPGLWLQRITTKEPQDEMIEIAVAALRAAEPDVPDVDRSIDKGQEKVDE